MARLFFGGSFNPIHFGHLICARAVAEARGFDQVVLIPSGHPPHKPDQSQLAPAPARLQMTHIAVADEPTFTVNDVELHQQQPNYTLQTVRKLKENGEKQVHWLIGADMLNTLATWHRADELVREANMVIMSRPGWQFDWGVLPDSFQHLRANVVEAPRIQISATDIRARLHAGQSIRWLTPTAVADYIFSHRLYGTGNDGAKGSP